jgi:hypothetical protein
VRVRERWSLHGQPTLAGAACHLIFQGERPICERTKSTKDLLQDIAIIEWRLENGRRDDLPGGLAGRSWARTGVEATGDEGRQALRRQAPDLALA